MELNSSTIDELGSWCLRRAGGAGQQFWQREGGIHRNPASGDRPGTVTLIESVEYLPHPILTQGREEWERKALQNAGKPTAKTTMT